MFYEDILTVSIDREGLFKHECYDKYNNDTCISCICHQYDCNFFLFCREKVVSMFHHAYDGYIKYAYPYDELRPLTCDGHDTWGR